jgi:hypothetical protein
MQEAIELALELPSQGFHDIKVRNPHTGEVYDEAHIVEAAEAAKRQEDDAARTTP